MMKVHTFWQAVPGLNLEDEYKLLLLWRNRWARAGFEPIVLNEYIARKHPLWAEFEQRINLLPSINPPPYERGCYVRWLAVAQAGGGIMVDFDCMPYGKYDWPTTMPTNLVSLQGYTPSVVYGNASAFEKVCRAFMGYEVGVQDMEHTMRPHVSDMLILLRGNVPYQQRHVVKMFGEDGWEEAPFVHYSSSSMSTAKKLPRYKWIPELRKEA